MMGELRDIGGVIDPRKYRLTASRHIGIMEWREHRSDVEGFVRSEMQQMFAAKLAQKRVQRIDREFSIEYRADLFVFSPDELWGIVQQTAMEYARRMTPFKVMP